MWTIDGPMMTEVDELMCFSLWHPRAVMGSHAPMGICIVQTWLGGGWEIYLPPTDKNEIDETARAIVRNRVSAKLVTLVKQFRDTCEYYIRKSRSDGDEEGARLKMITKMLIDSALAEAGETDVVQPAK